MSTRKLFILLFFWVIPIQSVKTTDLTDFGNGISKLPKGVLEIIINEALTSIETSDETIDTFIKSTTKAKQLVSEQKKFKSYKYHINPKILDRRFFKFMCAWVNGHEQDKIDLSNFDVARYFKTLFELIEESQNCHHTKKGLEEDSIGFKASIFKIIRKQLIMTHNIGVLYVISHKILSDYKICKKIDFIMLNPTKKKNAPLCTLYHIIAALEIPIYKDHIFGYFRFIDEEKAADKILEDTCEEEKIYCKAYFLVMDKKIKEAFPYIRKFLELSEKKENIKLKFFQRKIFIDRIYKAIDKNVITFISNEEKEKFLVSSQKAISRFLIF